MPPGWKKNMLRGDIWWKAVSRMARRTITSFCKRSWHGKGGQSGERFELAAGCGWPVYGLHRICLHRCRCKKRKRRLGGTEKKTIAISNQKGGVGKTTTAVSLSVALARQGKRVLLIDADSQADATKYLGVENPDELQNTLSTAMHCIINDLPYKTGGYIQSHPEGLDFVPSSIDLSSVEVELVNAMSRERILKSFLDDVRG